MTAEEFAREALKETRKILDRDIWDDRIEDEILVAELVLLFQAALETPVPVKFVKGFVPEEEGCYWWNHTWSKKIHLLKVFPKKNIVFLDEKPIMTLTDAVDTGRFSPRLIPPEGK